MSDFSQGPGWWLASDDKWYPPEQRNTAGSEVSQGPGWWLASDGKWYPSGETLPPQETPAALPPPEPTALGTLDGAAGHGARNWLIGGGIVAVILALAVVLALVLTKGTPANVPSPLASSSSTSAAPLSGAASIGPWLSSNASVVSNLVDAINTLGKEATSCASAPSIGCVAADGSDCSALAGVAQSAQSAPPIPDPTAEQEWSTALSDFAQGAQECAEGSTNDNLTLIDQAVQQISTAKGDLETVVVSAGSGSVPTTTTG